MLVWFLVAACWVGLFLLILHDVTKDDDGGSAVSIASRNATIASRNATIAAARGLRRLRRLRRRAAAARKARTAEAFAQADLATIAAETVPEQEVSPQTVPEETVEQTVTEQTVPGQTASAQTVPAQAAEPSKKTWWRRDQRAQVSPAELEHTITEAIRKTAPECGSFVGVIVHHKKPKQSRDPNWGVRGVKYGKADRRIVEQSLPDIVKQLQKEFRLTDTHLRN
jgi:hypothetical protein